MSRNSRGRARRGAGGSESCDWGQRKRELGSLSAPKLIQGTDSDRESTSFQEIRLGSVEVYAQRGDNR